MLSQRPLQLLHIDDSSVLRKTVARGLESYKEHYTLTQASSAAEALALLHSGHNYDVILTDWLMTEMDGLALLCTLKVHPKFHHLPVFFLTSEYEDSSLVTAVNYGASGLLKKPCSGTEIHAYLQKKRPLIEQCHLLKNNSLLPDGKLFLTELSKLLPLKNMPDLMNAVQQIQGIKAEARATQWPLFADYCQKIEDAIQLSLKKETAAFAPLTGLIQDFVSFLQTGLAEIEKGHPHSFLSKEIEQNLKNFQTGLEAGWFGSNDSPPTPVGGVIITFEILNELQKHLSPAGLNLLQPFLKEIPKAG